MKDITILDLNNGCIFIKFGDEYAHIYEKSNTTQILEDLKAWEAEHDCGSWDNNELENWEQCYNETEKLDCDEFVEQTKEFEAARILRNWLGFENDDELIREDFDNDYLTVNIGADEECYIWYCDESNNAAINVNTHEIISDEEEIDRIFNIARE